MEMNLGTLMLASTKTCSVVLNKLSVMPTTTLVDSSAKTASGQDGPAGMDNHS